MSIDAAILALTTALIANTAALEKAAGVTQTAGAATETKTTGKGRTAAEKKADEPKITQEQVNAALIKIKDDFGMPAAKEVIKEFGKVEKMSEIKPAQFQAVFDAAVAKHAELSAGGEEEKGDDL